MSDRPRLEHRGPGGVKREASGKRPKEGIHKGGVGREQRGVRREGEEGGWEGWGMGDAGR